MKLGEYLVREGELEPPQLKAALDAQLIYGGHLGTCLIEKGFINEIQLGRALARTFGVRCADSQMFDRIPRFLIAVLSPELAQKLKAVPIGLENKILDVAMMDPCNLTALDELSFATGHQISPWVGPEARIYQAMERYYGVPRRQRFITLCDRMDADADTAAQPELEITAGFLDRRDADGLSSRASIYQASSCVSAAEAATLTDASTDRYLQSDLDDAFCEAQSEGELARLTLAHTSMFMERGILFQTRGGVATILRAEGIDLSQERAEALDFPVISEPLFALTRGADHFRGSVPNELRKAAFFDRLELDLPGEMLLVPMYAEDQLVGLFYGDGGRGLTIEGPTEDYLRLFGKLALALNLVQLKRQIRVI